MPFEIDKGDSYPWPVALEEPENRRHKPEQFTGIFARLSQPRINELNEQIRQRMIAAQAGEPTEGMIDDIDIAREVLIGWSDITDSGSQVAYSDDLKEQLLSRASFAAFVVRAWNDSLANARKKTSSKPPGIA